MDLVLVPLEHHLRWFSWPASAATTGVHALPSPVVVLPLGLDGEGSQAVRERDHGAPAPMPLEQPTSHALRAGRRGIAIGYTAVR